MVILAGPRRSYGWVPPEDNFLSLYVASPLQPRRMYGSILMTWLLARCTILGDLVGRFMDSQWMECVAQALFIVHPWHQAAGQGKTRDKRNCALRIRYLRKTTAVSLAFGLVFSTMRQPTFSARTQAMHKICAAGLRQQGRGREFFFGDCDLDQLSPQDLISATDSLKRCLRYACTV